MILNGMSKMHSNAVAGFIRPTYISHTSATIENYTTITLTKPTDVAIGDLLIILVGNDYDGSFTQWNDTTNKPSGFTLIITGGSSLSDTRFAAFWRVADGTEGATIDVTSFSYAYQFGFYIHIKGANAVSPIGVLSDSYLDFGSSNHNLTASVTNGNIDDLGIYILSFDGGDGFPFAVTSGVGWVEKGEVQVYTTPITVSGTFGIKDYDSITGENVNINSSVNDGGAGFQFRISK